MYACAVLCATTAALVDITGIIARIGASWVTLKVTRLRDINCNVTPNDYAYPRMPF